MKRGKQSASTDMILSFAVEVMRKMGMGHRESVYHRAIAACLSNNGIRFRSEAVTPIVFMGECVGMGRADLVVDNLVIEVKANNKCPSKASGQLKKYMESLLEIEKRNCTGLVINFNQNTGSVEYVEEPLVEEQRVVKRSRFFHQEPRIEHPMVKRAREELELAARKLRQTQREYEEI